MRDSLYLAWKYICHHRGTTAVLVGAIAMIAYLPAALQSIVTNAQEHFHARAASTPLVIGPKQSALELVLASVFFDKPYTETMRMHERGDIDNLDLGQTIPVHVRFEARDHLIVGTTADYTAFRGLRIAQGTPWGILGQCVVGARVADRLQLKVGDRLPVSTSNAFVLDDAPLRLEVAGIYAPTETPDDDSIFVWLRTAWTIEGLGHGHATGAEHGTSDAATYTDITAENADSFHFHGDQSTFPISAVLVVPRDAKSETLLLGKYLAPESTLQAVQPSEVIEALMEKVLMVRSYMLSIIGVVSLATVTTMILALALSVRLRRAEIDTMTKMGCSRFTLTKILGSQMAIILAAGLMLAVILTYATNAFGAELVRLLIL